MLTTVIGIVHGGLFACVCVCSRARPGKVLQTKEEWVCKWTGVSREATRIQGKHIVHINVTTCVQTVRDRAPPTFAHFPSTPIFLSRQGVYCANLGARIAWPTINSHTWLSRSVCPDQTLTMAKKCHRACLSDTLTATISMNWRAKTVSTRRTQKATTTSKN